MSQSAVDNFPVLYPGCKTINGTLLIQRVIYNLNGLSSIEQINGDLRILEADSLKNLSGLGNLLTVGEYVYIAGNDKLTSTSSLNIENIGKNLEIYSNPKLSDVYGFSNVNYINNSLILHNNPSLTTLAGLEALKSVGLHMSLNSLPIKNLKGLLNLAYVKVIEFSYLPELTSFAGLPGNISVGELGVSGNNNLEDLSGLGVLDNIGTKLQISNNYNLKDDLKPSTGAFFW